MASGRRGLAIAGFMGVGKSTVGARLAERWGMPFVDLDGLIVRRQDATIPEIFARSGEVGFRAAETAALEAVLAGPGVVLALGGGTLHQPGARGRLVGAGYRVVSLVAQWQTLAGRIAADAGGRPLAADAERLFRLRAAGYEEADVVVPVDGLSPDEVVDRLSALVEPPP